MRMAGAMAPADIEAEIGRGGMGLVFRAEHINLGRRAAIKIIAPDSGTVDSGVDYLANKTYRMTMTLDFDNSSMTATAQIVSGQADWTHNFVPNVEKAYIASASISSHGTPSFRAISSASALAASGARTEISARPVTAKTRVTPRS